MYTRCNSRGVDIIDVEGVNYSQENMRRLVMIEYSPFHFDCKLNTNIYGLTGLAHSDINFWFALQCIDTIFVS